jgi:hypothetical protein
MRGRRPHRQPSPRSENEDPFAALRHAVLNGIGTNQHSVETLAGGGSDKSVCEVTVTRMENARHIFKDERIRPCLEHQSPVLGNKIPPWIWPRMAWWGGSVDADTACASPPVCSLSSGLNPISRLRERLARGPANNHQRI